MSVKEGDKVKRGQTLGKVGGSMGRATGPLLHIGLRWLGQSASIRACCYNPTSLPSVRTLRQAERKIEKADSAIG
ncbi:MAG: M23 family metallopeptidase [Xanthomonadales bacterium]|nr:M23 family metallopeptidase [Xanthomonadales bacterium]